ncbi:MAG: hypothetical protein ACOZAR_03755 [Patescibacteria group bacterium]
MKQSWQLILYSFCHLVVDLVCVALVLSSQRLGMIAEVQYWWLIVTYNFLAFGTQVGWGIWLDKWQKPKNAVMISFLLIIFGCLSAGLNVYAMVILLGLGNALFHVGAGSWVLNISEGKASKPGLFVAPGALGLFLGVVWSKAEIEYYWILVFLMGLCLILVFLLVKLGSSYQKKFVKVNFAWELVLFLMLLTVQLRSLLGVILVFSWKSNLVWLTVSVMGIVFGKGLGGILADKWGWRKIGVSSLLLSIGLLTWGVSNPLLATLGLFLFNFTMPITLTVLANVLPGRPGLAFGLTCLALWLGVIPSILGLDYWLKNGWVGGGLILLSAIALFFGLKYYYLFKIDHGKNV